MEKCAVIRRAPWLFYLVCPSLPRSKKPAALPSNGNFLWVSRCPDGERVVAVPSAAKPTPKLPWSAPTLTENVNLLFSCRRTDCGIGSAIIQLHNINSERS